MRGVFQSFTFFFSPNQKLTRRLVIAQANLIPLSLKRGGKKARTANYTSLNLWASRAGFCHMTFMWGSSVMVLSALEGHVFETLHLN